MKGKVKLVLNFILKIGHIHSSWLCAICFALFGLLVFQYWHPHYFHAWAGRDERWTQTGSMQCRSQSENWRVCFLSSSTTARLRLLNTMPAAPLPFRAGTLTPITAAPLAASPAQQAAREAKDGCPAPSTEKGRYHRPLGTKRTFIIMKVLLEIQGLPLAMSVLSWSWS